MGCLTLFVQSKQKHLFITMAGIVVIITMTLLLLVVTKNSYNIIFNYNNKVTQTNAMHVLLTHQNACKAVT